MLSDINTLFLGKIRMSPSQFNQQWSHARKTMFNLQTQELIPRLLKYHQRGANFGNFDQAMEKYDL